MIINRLYETQNLLSLLLVSFLVGLRTYQHPCTVPVLVYTTVRRAYVSDSIAATVHCLNLAPYVTGFLFKHTTGAASLLASLAPSVNVQWYSHTAVSAANLCTELCICLICDVDKQINSNIAAYNSRNIK